MDRERTSLQADYAVEKRLRDAYGWQQTVRADIRAFQNFALPPQCGFFPFHQSLYIAAQQQTARLQYLERMRMLESN